MNRNYSDKNKRILCLFGLGSGLIFAVFLAILLIFYRSYQSSLVNESENHLLEISSQTVGTMDNILEGDRHLLQMARISFLNSYGHSHDREELTDYLKTLGDSLGTGAEFFVLDEDSLAYMPDGSRRTFALIEGISELTDAGSALTFVSGNADGNGILYMISPIGEEVFFDEKKLIGIGAGFDLNNISFALNNELFGTPASCYLVDKSGALVYQNNAARGMTSMQPFYYIQQFGSFKNISYDELYNRIMEQNKNGVVSYELAEKECYMTYNHLEKAPWILAVSYEKALVNASMNSFSKSILITGAVMLCILITVLLTTFLLLYRNMKALYRKDLSERKRHLSEVAEQVYDDQISVEVDTMKFYHYRFRQGEHLPFMDDGSYPEAVCSFISLFEPPYRETVQELMAPEALTKSSSNGEKQHPDTVEACLKIGNRTRWLQLTRFLHAEEGHPVATIMSLDITDEVELRQQLKQSLKEAENANQAKSQFLASMSHDIRTPMNAIVGMTDIASAHVEDPERVKDCLNKIEYSSRHLLSLINDVLDMSKIESGKLVISQLEFDLSEQLSSVSTIISAQAKDRDLKFDVHIHKIRHEKLIGDPLRMNQVLINLLGNSIKFTPAGGTVSLDVTELPGEVQGSVRYRLAVADTGIGMSKEFLPRMFEAFVQEDGRIGNEDRPKGTGLGMSISNSLVRLMGGTLEVESQLGKGTCFTVELPFQLPELPTVYEHLPKLRVLLVDDSAEICSDVTSALEELGLCVQYALSGEQAVHMAGVAHRAGEDYELAIIDWRMPGMDGIETASRIRQLVGEGLPIIMLSAYDWSEVQDQAMAAGITEFVSKPLFKGKLYKKLVQWTKQISDGQGEVSALSVQACPYEGRRFLLVDDNELNREIAREIMAMKGAVVEEAVDGRQALEAFAVHPEGYYDVILMDVQMPVMDGYEAARAIRALQRKDATDILILAVTADAFSEDIKRATEAGMDAHIAKPIDFDQLNSILEKMMLQKR